MTLRTLEVEWVTKGGKIERAIGAEISRHIVSQAEAREARGAQGGFHEFFICTLGKLEAEVACSLGSLNSNFALPFLRERSSDGLMTM